MRRRVIFYTKLKPPSHLSPLSTFISLRLLLWGGRAGVVSHGLLLHTYMQALYVVLQMALWARYEEVCVRARVCVCLCKGDHSILHGHYGIHYHLNDA